MAFIVSRFVYLSEFLIVAISDNYG